MPTPSEPESGGGLKYRVASAIVWTSVRFGGDIVTNLVVFMILARILEPSQFGAFVVSIVFAEVGRLAVTNGLVSSVFSSHAADDRTYETIFWGNLVVGLLFAVVGVSASSLIGAALGVAETSAVIATTSLIVPITALGATHTARNLRAFGHRTLAIRTVVAGLVSGALTIAAALNGYGVWALVIQRLTIEVVYAATAWLAFRWIPRFRVSWSILRKQFILGAGVLSAQTVALGLNRSQDIILSRFLGLGAVGIYRTGWKVIEQLIQGSSAPFSTVLSPTLNRFADQPVEFERAYLKTVGVCATVAFPAIIGFSCVADWVIPLIFGDKWMASIPLAQLLGLLFLPATLGFFVEPVLLVRNRPGPLLVIALFQVIVTIGLGVAAAPYGLLAFAAAYVARSYLILAVQLFFLQSAARIRVLAVLGSVWVPTLASAAMALAVIGAKRMPLAFDHAGLMAEVLRLGAVIAVGGVTYAGSTWLAIGAQARKAYAADLAAFTKNFR